MPITHLLAGIWGFDPCGVIKTRSRKRKSADHSGSSGL